MKKTLIVAGVALMLTACSPGDNKPKINQYASPDSACSSDDASEAASDTTVATRPEWLKIGASGSQGAVSWKVNGDASDLESMEKLLDAYGDLKDQPAGLSGRDEEGISENPLLFSAGPQVSSQAFGMLLEMMVSARIYRVAVELAVPGQPVRRLWSQLPVDRGLDDGSYVPSPDSLPRMPGEAPDMSPLNRYSMLTMLVVRDADSYQYQSGIDAAARMSHPETKFQMADLLKDGWNETLYTDMRETLSKLILKRQGPGPQALKRLEIGLTSSIEPDAVYSQWAAVFLLMNAVEVANYATDRGDRPELITTFRFTDALAKYK